MPTKIEEGTLYKKDQGRNQVRFLTVTQSKKADHSPFLGTALVPAPTPATATSSPLSLHVQVAQQVVSCSLSSPGSRVVQACVKSSVSGTEVRGLVEEMAGELGGHCSQVARDKFSSKVGHLLSQ